MKVAAAAVLLAACTPAATHHVVGTVTVIATAPPSSTTTTTTAPPPLVTIIPQPVSPSVSSTAYCETGRMASGTSYVGAVAGNRWPLGTRLRVSDSPLGPAIYTVADRIGHGSDLDFALPGLCRAARHWGRRTVTVEVVR